MYTYEDLYSKLTIYVIVPEFLVLVVVTVCSLLRDYILTFTVTGHIYLSSNGTQSSFLYTSTVAFATFLSFVFIVAIRTTIKQKFNKA